MKTATASLCIEIWVHCPHCDHYINLRDPDDTNGHDHDECGDLLQQACPSVGHWSEEHEKFEADEVTCSACKKDFDVRGMDW